MVQAEFVKVPDSGEMFRQSGKIFEDFSKENRCGKKTSYIFLRFNENVVDVLQTK